MEEFLTLTLSPLEMFVLDAFVLSKIVMVRINW